MLSRNRISSDKYSAAEPEPVDSVSSPSQSRISGGDEELGGVLSSALTDQTSGGEEELRHYPLGGVGSPHSSVSSGGRRAVSPALGNEHRSLAQSLLRSRAIGSSTMSVDHLERVQTEDELLGKYGAPVMPGTPTHVSSALDGSPSTPVTLLTTHETDLGTPKAIAASSNSYHQPPASRPRSSADMRPNSARRSADGAGDTLSTGKGRRRESRKTDSQNNANSENIHSHKLNTIPIGAHPSGPTSSRPKSAGCLPSSMMMGGRLPSVSSEVGATVSGALCPRCQESYRKQPEGRLPRILECGHTHCTVCAVSLWADGQLVCFVCSGITKIESPYSLPTNRALLELIEQISRMMMASGGTPAASSHAPHPRLSGASALPPRPHSAAAAPVTKTASFFSAAGEFLSQLGRRTSSSDIASPVPPTRKSRDSIYSVTSGNSASQMIVGPSQGSEAASSPSTTAQRNSTGTTFNNIESMPLPSRNAMRDAASISIPDAHYPRSSSHGMGTISSSFAPSPLHRQPSRQSSAGRLAPPGMLAPTSSGLGDIQRFSCESIARISGAGGGLSSPEGQQPKSVSFDGSGIAPRLSSNVERGGDRPFFQRIRPPSIAEDTDIQPTNGPQGATSNGSVNAPSSSRREEFDNVTVVECMSPSFDPQVLDRLATASSLGGGGVMSGSASPHSMAAFLGNMFEAGRRSGESLSQAAVAGMMMPPRRSGDAASAVASKTPSVENVALATNAMMVANADKSNLQDPIEARTLIQAACPRCANPYGDDHMPRLLSCFHTFCESCLGECIEEDRTRLVCPQCDAETPFNPDLGVKALPRNLALQSISALPVDLSLKDMTAETLTDMAGATCPVCLESYIVNPPRLLRCGHSICTRCLFSMWMRDFRSVLKCPVCRENTRLPPTGICTLPINHALATLMRDWCCVLNDNSNRWLVRADSIPIVRKSVYDEARRVFFGSEGRVGSDASLNLQTGVGSPGTPVGAGGVVAGIVQEGGDPVHFPPNYYAMRRELARFVVQRPWYASPSCRLAIGFLVCLLSVITALVMCVFLLKR